MKKLTLSVPKMYGDHHTLAVRSALAELRGVEGIFANSARKIVTVEYDDSAVNPAKIEDTLKAAGYGPGEEPPSPELPDATDDESPWFRFLPRYTWTNMVDLEMSGDFRKY